MPRAQPVVRYPSLRALKSVRGARHELARLYYETKRGLIDPQLAGRLAHMLAVMLGSTRDQDFEVRLDHLEAMVRERDAAPPRRLNGGHQGARP